MSPFAEMLGLNPADVQQLASTYAGYAAAKEKLEEGDDSRHWIASSWLIGALYQLLVEPAAAIPMFQNAARQYHRLDMPIWRVCQLCSTKNLNPFNNQQDRGRYLDHEEVFYQELQFQFVLDEMRTLERPGKYRENENGFQGMIPQLNIPYELVIRALYDSNQWDGPKPFTRLKNVGDIVGRLNELTELYRSDEYYWTHLEGQIIPFEPVAIAICLVFVKKWLKSGGTIESLTKNIGLKPQQTILLQIANGLLIE